MASEQTPETEMDINTDSIQKLPKQFHFKCNPDDELIEAISYKISVCENPIEAIRGGGHDIHEIYIPERNLTFNTENHQINAFFDNRVTGSTESIKLSKQMIKDICLFVTKRDELAEYRPEIKTYMEKMYGEPAENIDAVMYEIEIFDGPMDMVHGGGRTIKEIYVPQLNLSFNIENDVVNPFFDKRVSGPTHDIKVRKSLVDQLYDHCIHKNMIDKYI